MAKTSKKIKTETKKREEGNQASNKKPKRREAVFLSETFFPEKQTLAEWKKFFNEKTKTLLAQTINTEKPLDCDVLNHSVSDGNTWCIISNPAGSELAPFTYICTKNTLEGPTYDDLLDPFEQDFTLIESIVDEEKFKKIPTEKKIKIINLLAVVHLSERFRKKGASGLFDIVVKEFLSKKKAFEALKNFCKQNSKNHPVKKVQDGNKEEKNIFKKYLDEYWGFSKNGGAVDGRKKVFEYINKEDTTVLSVTSGGSKMLEELTELDEMLKVKNKSQDDTNIRYDGTKSKGESEKVLAEALKKLSFKTFRYLRTSSPHNYPDYESYNKLRKASDLGAKIMEEFKSIGIKKFKFSKITVRALLESLGKSSEYIIQNTAGTKSVYKDGIRDDAIKEWEQLSSAIRKELKTALRRNLKSISITTGKKVKVCYYVSSFFTEEHIKKTQEEVFTGIKESAKRQWTYYSSKIQNQIRKWIEKTPEEKLEIFKNIKEKKLKKVIDKHKIKDLDELLKHFFSTEHMDSMLGKREPLPELSSDHLPSRPIDCWTS